MCVWNLRNIYIRCTRKTRHILWSRSRVKLALGCPFFCSLRFFVSAFWVRFALFWRPCMRCMLFLVSLFVLCFCCARPWSCLVRGRLLQKHPRRLDIVYLASICKDGTGDLRTAFCLLHSSACLIQQLQDLDMAYSTQRLAGTDMWFGCNMLLFSMPTWPCLVAKLCGVAPKELAWDGLARNSKSIRQIERS